MHGEQIQGFRLSPQQKHIWLLHQIKSCQSYCILGEILITGHLDLEALKKALQAVVDKYEILRTAFQNLPGMILPLQVITEQQKVLIHERRLNNLTQTAHKSAIKLLSQELKDRPFDTGESSHLCAYIFKVSSEEHVLLLYLSALIADSLSLRQIVSQLSDFYAASVLREKPNDPADETMQYADIAEWQNALLEQENYAAGQDYWRSQRNINNPGNSINWLGSKRANDHNSSEFKVSSVPISIGPDLARKIESTAQRAGQSVANILLTCWQTLLWRMTGKQSLTVGITSNGRQYEELADAVGPLSKSLPLAARIEENIPFSEVLSQVSESVTDAHRWQDYFVAEENEWVDDHSSSSRCPFLFEFEEWPEKYSSNGISFSLNWRYACTERFHLNLFCLQQGSRLSPELQYDAGLYESVKIEALAEYFLTSLEEAVDNPQVAADQLRLLSDRQRAHILTDFNQAQRDYAPVQCLHQLFESQVKRTPNDVAVVFEDRQLTYAELNAQANQLAHYLQRLGVGVEDLVGIYLQRSLDLVVSLLAVLKAGGAYVPLDPALPPENVAFRLQDAQTSVLLTQVDLQEKLSGAKSQVVCLDRDGETIAQEKAANCRSSVTPQHLAYVLFTSGSTGKPKGVAVEHQQLFNYTQAISDELALSACRSFATVSTFAADLGNTAIFPALTNGGCLHVIASDRAANPEALAEYFLRHPIDCLKIVPSHLAALLSASHPEHILPRQRLILGGEACRWQLIEQIQCYQPSCQIFNHYGPTEATIGVLTYPIDTAAWQNRQPQQETVPIGKPIANAQTYLLDSEQQPVPIGVPGELYIGGAGVARGYLNRPELTAERFVPTPFLGKAEDGIQESGVRSQEPCGAVPSPAHSHPATQPRPTLYKTGDLARYRPDGTLEFLGRVDHQVKVRGYRIELGEIEAALRQYPAVQDTVVVVREAQPGNQRLVAYVVSHQQSTLDTDELRQSLKGTLPDYMVPATWVELMALPLTPNGKVDRQALPAPEVNHQDWEATFVAPSTPAEETLAKIWAQTLGLETVGIHNNFFELGGDSILSIQIVARASQAGLKLTPKQVFENQTIAELASVATTQQAIEAQQGPVKGLVPLTPIQHWFFGQDLPEPHHWNQSLLLEVQHPLELGCLEQAVKAVLDHHDALRLRFVREETGWRQFEADIDESVPLVGVDLSRVSEADQTQALVTQATELQASLNLTSGPLMRVAYFDLGSEKTNRLLIIIHHLAVDGVSWRILLEDLQIAHQQLSQGVALQLPPKTTSFQYWAEQLVNYAHSETQQQELEHWLHQSSHQVVPFPVDFPEGTNTIVDTATVSVALSEAETVALLQEVPTAYRTQINDVLLTALLQTFAQWTGQRSLLVDLEGHGREDLFDNVDLSRTVGWFTTLFPVWLEIAESGTPGDMLKAVKERLRQIPNRGIGYGILRYLSDPDSGQWPYRRKAEVRFNYLGQTDQVFQQSSLFALAQEPRGLGRSPQGTRYYPLDISGVIAGGQLRIDWTYSQARYRQTTIDAQAMQYIQALRSLIAHCQSPDAGGFTPSDFSEADLNQQELDQFLAKIKGKA